VRRKTPLHQEQVCLRRKSRLPRLMIFRGSEELGIECITDEELRKVFRTDKLPMRPGCL
jgi:hypothetical protein